MNKRKRPTPEQLEAFKDDIRAVYNKYGLALAPYHYEYDEYEIEEGLEVVDLIDEFYLNMACYER